MQRRVMGLFHFALRPGGGLFLGSSEGISQQGELFESVSKKWHLYRRIGSTGRGQLSFPSWPTRGTRGATCRCPAAPPGQLRRGGSPGAARNHAPASVLINKRYQVLYFHGPTSRYLQQPSGEPTLDLLSMAHDELGTNSLGPAPRCSRRPAGHQHRHPRSPQGRILSGACDGAARRRNRGPRSEVRGRKSEVATSVSFSDL